MRYEIVLAADYLDIQPLLYVEASFLTLAIDANADPCTNTHSHLGCKVVKDMIKGGSAKEIRNFCTE
jgi:hypothetical protein